ncbi:MAG: hypothetical protein Q4A81_07350 [Pasteurellaceae bacterium]|nr:hypothetical protein [Pasteurellaceae bacterium]
MPDQVSEVYREEKFNLDKRKNKERNQCSIDLMIRQRNAHSFIPIEIKQHKTASQCINYMICDIHKYETIKPSELSTDRLLWCIGIHQIVEKETIIRIMREKNFDTKFVYTNPIKDTNFMITIF